MDRLDSMFMLYLDEALVLFDEPHQFTNEKRLDKYRTAFRKVVGDAFKSAETTDTAPGAADNSAMVPLHKQPWRPSRCSGCIADKEGCTTCARCWGDRYATAS